MLQRLPFQKFQDDERVGVGLADFVNGANVGVIERGSGAGLAAESFECLRILCEFFWKKLQRDVPAEIYIFGFIHYSHAASAEFLEDAVVRNSLSDDGREVRHFVVILGCAPLQVNETQERRTAGILIP
jgi:hypothetical protein